MNDVKRRYSEPVFYFNPKGNCFLDAEFITKSSIILHHQSQVPNNKGQIEFSFPNSNHIVSCDFDLSLSNGKYQLKFRNLKSEDEKYLTAFIKNKNLSTPIESISEATL